MVTVDGGFGGGHSSGGFSGGGRSSRSYSSRSHSSSRGFGGPSRNSGFYNRRPGPIHRGPYYHRPSPGYGYGYRSSNSSIWSTIIVFFIIAMIIVLPNIQNKVPKNTTQRVA